MRPRFERALTPAVVVAGSLLALQGRVNGELGRRIDSPIDAALVSFAVGTVVMSVVLLAADRSGAARLRAAPVRWWWWLGGIAGAAVVAATADGVPQIGVALVTVCIVAGTGFGALAVDEMGLGPGGRRQITRDRLAGALLAVAAVALGAAGDRHAAVRPLLFVVLFLAGAASAWQQAANGQLRRVSASTAAATWVSFASGTVALVVVAAARGELGGRAWPSTWWLYTGGLLGAVYIALAAASVTRLGVLRLLLATVAGQLAGAVVLDLVWPAPGTHLRATTAVGALLTLVAVAVTGRSRAAAPLTPAGGD